MAVSHNAFASGSVDAGATVNFNVIVLAGTNRVACVGISWFALVLANVATVTVGGEVATFIQLSIGPLVSTEQHYVVAPALGSNAVSVSFDGGAVALVGCEVLNDVVQASPIGSKATAGGTGTSAVSSLVTTTDGSMLVDTVVIESAGVTALTADASQTQMIQSLVGTVPNRIRAALSRKNVTGSPATMSWTISPSSRYSLCAAEFLFQSSDTGKPVNCYTSYQYAADPTPVESFKDPAVQQRIWVNDRRHMQGDL